MNAINTSSLIELCTMVFTMAYIIKLIISPEEENRRRLNNTHRLAR